MTLFKCQGTVFCISTNWGHCQLIPQKPEYPRTDLGKMTDLTVGLWKAFTNEIRNRDLDHSVTPLLSIICTFL